MRKSRIEYKWSDLAQRADVTADMVNRQQRATIGLMRRGEILFDHAIGGSFVAREPNLGAVGEGPVLKAY
jgi:hypothetical protein